MRNKDLLIGDLCTEKTQLRPHIVWFGEDVPMLDTAIKITQQADILVIIGTSMQVYPAASLVNYVAESTPIYFIDINPAVTKNQLNNLTVIKDLASSGTTTLLKMLTEKSLLF